VGRRPLREDARRALPGGAGARTNPEEGTMADDDDTNELLKEIRDLQREELDRQNRFLWVLVPIFAILCIQTVLLLVR
jgi:hypothetical protein